MVKIKLETNATEYLSEAETMLEALEKLNLNYTHIKAKGVITFERGKNKGSKLMYLRQLRMLFANKTRRVGWAKQFEMLLEANKTI